MRSLVLALLTGCSSLVVGVHNKPPQMCSRSAGYIDAVLATTGVAGGITLLVLRGEAGTDEHGAAASGLAAMAGASFVFALFEALQASHGVRVAERCEALRAKYKGRTRAPVW